MTVRTDSKKLRTGRRTLPLRVACGALIAALAGCSSSSSNDTPTSFETFTTPATSGWGADDADVTIAYRPSPNGLSFQNYPAPSAITVADTVALFGDNVVCSEPAGACTPSPEFVAWTEQVAAAAAGGVCEGMAVFALDRWLSGETPETSTLTQTDVSTQVVRLFATQFTETVTDAARSHRGKSMNEVVARIETALADGTDPLTLGLYHQGGGHTLVPYAVKHISRTHVAIYVYDPNWPGVDRFVEIDTAANSWRYAFNSPDAALDVAPWFGTGNELDLVPLSARRGPLRASLGTAKNKLLTITTTGDGWEVITGATTLTARQAVPGAGPVVNVVRGNFGAVTVQLVVGDDTIVNVPAGGAVMVSDKNGALRADSTGRSRFKIAGDTSTLYQQDGTGSIASYTKSGIVTAASRAGAMIEHADTTVRYVSSAGDATVVERRDNERRDVRIDDSGQHDVETAALPAEVRQDAGASSLASENGTRHSSGTTDTTDTAGTTDSAAGTTDAGTSDSGTVNSTTSPIEVTTTGATSPTTPAGTVPPPVAVTTQAGNTTTYVTPATTRPAATTTTTGTTTTPRPVTTTTTPRSVTTTTTTAVAPTTSSFPANTTGPATTTGTGSTTTTPATAQVDITLSTGSNGQVAIVVTPHTTTPMDVLVWGSAGQIDAAMAVYRYTKQLQLVAGQSYWIVVYANGGKSSRTFVA